MQWWNDLVIWLSSDTGWRVVTDAFIPILAILVAGFVAAYIARNSVKRLLARQDRDQRAAAIGALVNAARQASVWDSLSPQEQILADRAAGDADISVRLLPIRGADVAADWAAHEILEFKRGSATFGFQFDTLLIEFRARLIDWQRHPARARKIFQGDIARWSVELTETERQLQSKQDAWVAEQHSARFPAKVPAGSAASSPAQAPARAQVQAQAQAHAQGQAQPHAPAPAARPVSAASATYAAPSYVPTDDGSSSSAPTGPLRQSAVLAQASASPREVEAPDEDFAGLPRNSRLDGPVR
jgi:hypothetical protein